MISITKRNAGTAYNIIPEFAELAGTVRTYSSDLRDFAERQILQLARGVARGFGGDAELKYRRDCPVTFNETASTDQAIHAARALVGHVSVNDKMAPRMGPEDFAYMLDARPGAFIYILAMDPPLPCITVPMTLTTKHCLLESGAG